MGRSRVISDEQILKAAQEMFLEEGFGASTLAIARHAGISEASIFKRFATKEALFFAAMGLAPMTEQISELATLIGQGEIQDNLVTLALRILKFLRATMPRMMMIASKSKLPHIPPTETSASLDAAVPADPLSPLAFPCPLSLPPSLPIQAMILADFQALAAFFQAEQALGRIRSGDPEVLAYLFLGSLMSYHMQERLRNIEHSDADSEIYVKSLIHYLWQGIGTH